MMKILKLSFEYLKSIDKEELVQMNKESEFIISSFNDGLSGVGEFLQVTILDDVSPDAVHNVGSMLVMLGYIVENTAANEDKIVLAMKK